MIDILITYGKVALQHNQFLALLEQLAFKYPFDILHPLLDFQLLYVQTLTHSRN